MGKPAKLQQECFSDVDGNLLKRPTVIKAVDHRDNHGVTNEKNNILSYTVESTENVEATYTWKDVSSALDNIFFWIFLVSNCFLFS